jgi:hypothetical protein
MILILSSEMAEFLSSDLSDPPAEVPTPEGDDDTLQPGQEDDGSESDDDRESSSDENEPIPGDIVAKTTSNWHSMRTAAKKNDYPSAYRLDVFIEQYVENPRRTHTLIKALSILEAEVPSSSGGQRPAHPP